MSPDQVASSLPQLLGMDQVVERYGVADRRAARKIMVAVGSLRVGRLYVRLVDLLAFEAARREVARAPTNERTLLAPSASAAEFAVKTLRRARERLGVESSRVRARGDGGEEGG